MSLTTIQTVAPGKVILLGEHFVVGRSAPGIAMGVHSAETKISVDPISSDLIASVSAENEEGRLCSHAQPNPTLQTRPSSIEKIYSALASMELEDVLNRYQWKISTNFPLQRGLGSSASVGLALGKALLELKEISSISAFVEKFENYFHGSASGIDVAAIMNPGVILFHHPEKFFSLKGTGCCDLLIVDSGARKDSRTLVTQLQKLKNKDPISWNLLARDVLNCVNLFCEGFQKGEIKSMSEAIVENQKILATLDLSTDSIDSLIHEGLRQGALAGKVSGAGGGGILIFLCRHEDGPSLKAHFENRDFFCLLERGLQ